MGLECVIPISYGMHRPIEIEEKMQVGELAGVALVAQHETTEDGGHSHTAFIFRNGDRVSGYTSIENGHFHVFDAPVGWINETAIQTTPNGTPPHKHTVIEAPY